ncbi:MAG: type transporter [Naasia sp.]|nr:type transporter [Naasia sp.]
MSTMLRTRPARAAHEAGGGLREDARAVGVVWRRELLRFSRNRLRMVTSLMQPLLFLFVLGTGLSQMVPSSEDVDFRTFMFPGVIAMTVLFSALFSAITVVWDREFGFMREMLVAPVARRAIVVGKCAGGATIATLQGAVMLAFAGLVDVPYSLSLMLILLGEMAIAAAALTALGVLLASRIARVESFMALLQFILLPLFFLSGAVFSTTRLPGWLSALTKLDPLTYAVDPMRRAVFAHVDAPASLERTLNPGVHWGGWKLPVAVELAIVALLGILMLAAAIAQFERTS